MVTQDAQNLSLWTLIPAIAGAIAATLTILAAARAWLGRTILRRRDRYRRLARLGTGAHLSFFESVLGEPPAISRTVVKDNYAEYRTLDDPEFVETSDEGAQLRFVSRSFGERIFIDRDYYVQAICDDDDTVLAFSVTTRSKRFRPAFEVQYRPGLRGRLRYRKQTGEWPTRGVKVRLGKTTFSELEGGEDLDAQPSVRLALGANNWAYCEVEYLGRSGHYQTFVWSMSDASGAGRQGALWQVAEELPKGRWPQTLEDDPRTLRDLPALAEFRRQTTITSLTVIGRNLLERNFPGDRFTPPLADVWTLP